MACSNKKEIMKVVSLGGNDEISAKCVYTSVRTDRLEQTV